MSFSSKKEYAKTKQEAAQRCAAQPKKNKIKPNKKTTLKKKFREKQNLVHATKMMIKTKKNNVPMNKLIINMTWPSVNFICQILVGSNKIILSPAHVKRLTKSRLFGNTSITKGASKSKLCYDYKTTSRIPFAACWNLSVFDARNIHEIIINMIDALIICNS